MPPKKTNYLRDLKNCVIEYNNQGSKCLVILNGKKYDKFSVVQEKLEEKYDKLCQAFESYKEDMLERITEAEFNEVHEDGSGPVYTYNNAWKTSRDTNFNDLYSKLSDDTPAPSEEEEKVVIDQHLLILCQRIGDLMEVIGDATNKMEQDVAKMPDSSAEESVLNEMKNVVSLQKDRVNVELSNMLEERSYRQEAQRSVEKCLS